MSLLDKVRGLRDRVKQTITGVSLAAQAQLPARTANDTLAPPPPQPTHSLSSAAAAAAAAASTSSSSSSPAQAQAAAAAAAVASSTSVASAPLSGVLAPPNSSASGVDTSSSSNVEQHGDDSGGDVRAVSAVASVASAASVSATTTTTTTALRMGALGLGATAMPEALPDTAGMAFLTLNESVLVGVRQRNEELCAKVTVTQQLVRAHHDSWQRHVAQWQDVHAQTQGVSDLRAQLRQTAERVALLSKQIALVEDSIVTMSAGRQRRAFADWYATERQRVDVHRRARAEELDKLRSKLKQAAVKKSFTSFFDRAAASIRTLADKTATAVVRETKAAAQPLPKKPSASAASPAQQPMGVDQQLVPQPASPQPASPASSSVASDVALGGEAPALPASVVDESVHARPLPPPPPPKPARVRAAEPAREAPVADVVAGDAAPAAVLGVDDAPLVLPAPPVTTVDADDAAAAAAVLGVDDAPLVLPAPPVTTVDADDAAPAGQLALVEVSAAASGADDDGDAQPDVTVAAPAHALEADVVAEAAGAPAADVSAAEVGGDAPAVAADELLATPAPPTSLRACGAPANDGDDADADDAGDHPPANDDDAAPATAPQRGAGAGRRGRRNNKPRA